MSFLKSDDFDLGTLNGIFNLNFYNFQNKKGLLMNEAKILSRIERKLPELN